MMDSPCPSIFAANMGLSKMNKMWKFSTFDVYLHSENKYFSERK